MLILLFYKHLSCYTSAMIGIVLTFEFFLEYKNNYLLKMIKKN
jgi:hypothetical protein